MNANFPIFGLKKLQFFSKEIQGIGIGVHCLYNNLIPENSQKTKPWPQLPCLEMQHCTSKKASASL